MTDTLTADKTIARLRWQCRRGMLELDAFLNAFLDKRYAGLSEAEQQTFERVLRLPDPQLLDYLLLQAKPEDRDIADVIGQIRHSARP